MSDALLPWCMLRLALRAQSRSEKFVPLAHEFDELSTEPCGAVAVADRRKSLHYANVGRSFAAVSQNA